MTSQNSTSSTAVADDPGTPAAPGRLDPQLRREIRELFTEFCELAAGSPQHETMRSRLVELNTPLVKYLVRRFRNSSEPIEDITQVGMIGLLKAVDRFDPSRGLEFSTFAVPTILGEIRRYFRDSTWSVHVPRGTRELYSSVSAAIPEMSQRLGRAPTVSELSMQLGCGEDNVVSALEAGAAYSSKSLESMTENPGWEGQLLAFGAEDAGLERAERRADLRPALAKLPEKQQQALVLRFVQDKSQTQIAEELGVSQMQVSRLLARSMNELRAELSRSAPSRQRVAPQRTRLLNAS
ncbi:MAG TPA: SigB/SigF/SigG family RNA polymerase sigma factor [Jatrophihabitans sp.]|jgi:RNA polymerase sigma-B factor